MSAFKKITLAVLVSFLAARSQVVVERGRNEGTANIPATNVMGNGNITVTGGLAGSYRATSPEADPGAGVAIGVADILQVSGHMFFTDFKGLGASDAYVQLTTPGNDKLRFFGIAATANLHLSSDADTTGGSAAPQGKPSYDSYIIPSLTVDLDWLSLFKSLPLKTYVNVGLADDPDLLFRYDQIAVRTGLEWKTFEHSLFIDAGIGLYKEKERLSFAGDNSYQQQVAWLEPGIRYRVGGMLSIIGSLRVTAFEDLKKSSPLSTDLFRANVGLELPLVFKETNTEAIRTLVFMERIKTQKQDLMSRDMAQGKPVRTPSDSTLQTLPNTEQAPEVQSESDIIKRREEIEKKMEDIEKMLEDIQ